MSVFSIDSMVAADFSDSLLALLFYKGDGSVPEFYRYVELACESEGLEISASDRNRISRSVLSKFYSVGLLIRFERQGHERWSVGGNRIISVKDGLIGVGDCSFQLSFKNEFTKVSAKVHLIAPLMNCALSEISLWKYEANREYGLRLAQLFDVPFVEFDPLSLVEKLPAFSDCFNQVTVSTELRALQNRYGKASIFLYKSSANGWIEVEKVTAGGLFRVDHGYGLIKVYIFTEDWQGFEVIKKDWSLFLAKFLFKERIILKTGLADNVIEMKGEDLYSLPDLLRQIFMGSSMRWPSLNRSNYVFEDMQKELISALITKYSVFRYAHD